MAAIVGIINLLTGADSENSLLMLVFGLVLTLGSCGKKATIEGKGYNSPEEVIVAYAEALKSGDMAKIMAVHAVETYVDRYDLEEYLGCDEVTGLLPR